MFEIPLIHDWHLNTDVDGKQSSLGQMYISEFQILSLETKN